MRLFSVIFERKQISQINSCLEDCHNHKGKEIICYDAQFNAVICHPHQRKPLNLGTKLNPMKPIRAPVYRCILCTNLRYDGESSLGTGTLMVQGPTPVVFIQTILSYRNCFLLPIIHMY